ncbi:MAG: PIN domain-containing protein [Gammaproteobacteria bacterium]|nr:PIN domain-containing protein [Gammaproteobacteria bacterium]
MFLLDTNVLSEALKPSPEPRVVTWLDEHFPESAVSTVTLFELAAGVAFPPRGRRRDTLESAVARMTRRFADRIYAFDAAAAEAAVNLLIAARAAGLGVHQLPSTLADLQIAGTAAAYGLTLATRDAKDFGGLGLELIDPWAAPDHGTAD